MQIKCNDGILTGCNQTLEWMLPWWWMHYSMHNTFPVTFLDFGMSKKGLKWCQKRGNVIKIPQISVAEKKDISPEILKIWTLRTVAWELRPTWFQKPVGCVKTPYQRSIWIDIDCEIRGNVSSVFSLCENPCGLAISLLSEYAQEFLTQIQALLPGQKDYSSGVIVFRNDSPIIQAWAQRALHESHLFLGDQDILSRILFEANLPFVLIPPAIHAIPRRSLETLAFDEEGLIHHFPGFRGKRIVAERILELANTFLSGLADLMPRGLTHASKK